MKSISDRERVATWSEEVSSIQLDESTAREIGGSGRVPHGDKDLLTGKVPAELLLSAPDAESPVLSPDGKHIAYLAPYESVPNLWIRTQDWTQPRVITRFAHPPREDYVWSLDGRYLLIFIDENGKENWSLCAIDVESCKARSLTPVGRAQARGLWLAKDEPSKVATSVCTTRQGRYDLYKIDIESGESCKLADDPGVQQWILGRNVEVLGALFLRSDASMEIRSCLDGNWKGMLEIPRDDAVDLSIEGVSEDGTRVWLLSSLGGPTKRLLELELKTGRLDVAAEHPDYDICGPCIGLRGAWFDPVSGAPRFASIVPSRVEYLRIDDVASHDLAQVAKLDEGDQVIVSEGLHSNSWIVGFSRDNGPISYHLFDRTHRRSRFLFDHRPALRRWKLGSTEPFEYKARDGLQIRGYLTFPPTYTGTGPLPSVIIVHGGPWSRDTWRFNPDVQWFATRGYLCVQVNFRGSTGYGKEFRSKGNRQWGARMQHDLYDAVTHLRRLELVAPPQIGIFGASYGGYAALMAACSDEIELACSVAVSPPCDLTALLSRARYWGPLRSLLEVQLGTLQENAQELQERSPHHISSKCRVPVLLAHGRNNPRIPASHIEDVAARIRSQGCECRCLIFSNEGHSIVRPGNRLRIYAEIEKFMQAYLPSPLCQAQTEVEDPRE